MPNKNRSLSPTDEATYNGILVDLGKKVCPNCHGSGIKVLCPTCHCFSSDPVLILCRCKVPLETKKCELCEGSGIVCL